MICLTMIVRNEARCIARCLQSAAPFVDRMLVVDTGSTDATARIAREHGARVVDLAWPDDFSAARNFALAQADADWHLVLDADEWVAAGGAGLRPALAAARQPFVGQVSVRSAFDDGSALRHAASWISRLLPRGVRYRGRIHEQVVHRLSVRRLDLAIGHDGYRAAQQRLKGDRNERLLRRVLAERPHDAYAHYQLGKDLEVRRRYAEAADEYDRARALLGWPPADVDEGPRLQARYPWLHDLTVRAVFCLRHACRLDEAQARCVAEQRHWSRSPDFYFAWGDMLLDCALADPRRAAQWLPHIEACWLRCLELGEAPHLEGAVEGRGSFLAAHNLAVLNELRGESARAEELRACGAAARPHAAPNLSPAPG